MIKYKDIKGTSVEELVCNELHWSHKEPMSKELSKLLMKLYLMDHHMRDEDKNKFSDDLDDQFITKLIKSRSNVYQFKLAPTVVALLGLLTQVPGKAVMYLTYLQYIVSKQYKDLINKELTMIDIIKIFPVGFFSDEVLDKAWDAQKIDFRDEGRALGSDNLVDHQEAMESIWVK